MRKEPYFLFNRCVLILIIPFCFIVPLVQLPLFEPVQEASAVIYDMRIDLNDIVIKNQKHSFSFVLPLLIIYFTGAGFCLFRFVKNILFVQQTLFRQGFINNSNFTAFTFFRKIFVNSAYLSEKDYETVMKHEQTHARQLHSIDLILAELLIIVQWFNPFAWKIKKSFIEVHEYLADEHVIRHGTNLEQYNKLLYNQVTGAYPIGANAFNSLIKKRLVMIKKQKNGKRASLKICSLVIVAVFTVANFGCLNTNAKSFEQPKTDILSHEERVEEYYSQLMEVIDSIKTIVSEELKNPEIPKEDVFTIEEKIFNNNQYIGGILTKYKTVTQSGKTMYVPDKKYFSEIVTPLTNPSTFTSQGENALIYPSANIKYENQTTYGKCRSITLNDVECIVYLWSYNYQYPIDEIKGATYSEVTSKISESDMNTIAAKNIPTDTDWRTINGLRTKLPNAHVTIYKYQPLFGIESITDSNGVTSYYEYDGLGRLTGIKVGDKITPSGSDTKKNIETFEYHYK
jgi:YD repeat-containing protein